MQRWTSGLDAAKKFKGKSGEGKTPISELVIAGHCFGENRICNEEEKNCFEAAHVFKVATKKSNTQNTFKSASQRIGPPKCWIQRKAAVYAVGCVTANAFAPEWAEKIVRISASIRGAVPSLYGEWNGKRAFVSFVGHEADKYYTLGDLLASPHWETFDGTQ